jgi:hypothetical protein
LFTDQGFALEARGQRAEGRRQKEKLTSSFYLEDTSPVF